MFHLSYATKRIRSDVVRVKTKEKVWPCARNEKTVETQTHAKVLAYHEKTEI